MSWQLLKGSLYLACFCCAMRLWQYYVGVRLEIYALILLAFIGVYFSWNLCRQRMPLPERSLRPPLFWLLGILAVSALSFFLLDFELAPASTQAFWKRLVELVFYTAGLGAVLCFLSEASPSISRRALQAYILGAAISSLYSFFEVGCAYFGYDLGKAVFGRISTYPPDFDWSAPFYYEWDIFFRAVGFAGVNAQSTYTASVIPLLVLAKPFHSRFANLSLAALCLAGCALTLSRNGFFSLFVAFALYAMLKPAWAFRYLPRAAAVLLPVVLLVLVFSSSAWQMISTRLYSSIEDVGKGRREIYGSAWRSIVSHPLGHGVNQFSVVVINTDEIDLSEVAAEYYKLSDVQLRLAYANVHNNWLNWLFEGGWPLLLAELGFYGSLIVACWRTHTDLGLAVVCGSAVLLISGLFNMTLTQFSSDLFFVLGTAAAVRIAAKSEPAAIAPP